MSPTIKTERETALNFSDEIGRRAREAGWGIRSVGLPDGITIDLLVFKKGDTEEVVGVVFREGESDLIFGPEELLEGLGDSQK